VILGTGSNYITEGNVLDDLRKTFDDRKGNSKLSPDISVYAALADPPHGQLIGMNSFICFCNHASLPVTYYTLLR